MKRRGQCPNCRGRFTYWRSYWRDGRWQRCEHVWHDDLSRVDT